MRPCFVQLGRFGDICNILPLVWEKSQCGDRPTVLIAPEFSDILEGVLYCDTALWPGSWEDVAGAVTYARAKYDEVYVTQVHGNYPAGRFTESYCKDMWAQLGRLDWGSLPLVFDNRDEDREAKLRLGLGMKTIDSTPPVVLSLKGNSSPLHDTIQHAIRATFPKSIEVSSVKAHRIYDLLGVFENASVLITADTASVHLAHASNVPVIALVSNAHHGWGATSRYPGQILRVSYEHILTDLPIIKRVADQCQQGFGQRRLLHVWSDRQNRQPDALARHNRAKLTWESEYARGPWITSPISDSKLKRTSKEIGDPRPVPMINDLVEAAIQSAGDNDLIILTNEDIHFAPGLTDTLMKLRAQCGWSHRRDFSRIGATVTPIGLSAGLKYPGIDFFVFSKEWWRTVKFPPMWLGRQKWDLVMKAAMRLSDGIEIYCATAHEQHASFWSTGNNMNTNPANRWNETEADKWQARVGITIEE